MALKHRRDKQRFGSEVAIDREASFSVLREAERCFLQRDYKRSLLLVHSWFEKNQRELSTNVSLLATTTTTTTTTEAAVIPRSSTKNTVIRLFPPIRIPCEQYKNKNNNNNNEPAVTSLYLKADLKCISTSTCSDQLAVIGLQSWYELSKLERKLQSPQYRWLEGILHYYARQESSLSIELLTTVWIPFWESRGHEREALLWTIQCLGGTRREENVWLRCVCHQIPTHVNNSGLAKKLFDMATEEPTMEYSLQEIWKEMMNQDSSDTTKDSDETCQQDSSVIRALVESLDSYLGDKRSTPETSAPIRHARVSKRTMVRARRWLSRQEQDQQQHKTRTKEDESLQTPQRNKRHDDESMIIPKTNPSQGSLPYTLRIGSTTPQSIFRSLPRQLSASLQKLFRLVCKHRSGQLKDVDQLCLRKHLQQALLSMVLFWAGWNGRRLLIRCGRTVVWASLAPLRELVEALGAQTNNNQN